jgi:hypothetical protein
MGTVKRICTWCEELRPLAQFGMGLIAVGLFLYGVYTLRLWWTDTAPVIEYFGGEITPLVARPDEFMIVYLNIRKLRDCPGVVQRRLTGDCGEHRLSETATYLHAGFSGRITLPFQVPPQAIPGQCAFQVHTWFICNPFDFMRDRHYASPSIAFRVLRYDE